uniref:Uncharacterized protein n=1 Tax=Panagrolaimus sp. JU765 TaxID=591449 RepID=A0AC34R4Y9_9BILA
MIDDIESWIYMFSYFICYDFVPWIGNKNEREVLMMKETLFCGGYKEIFRKLWSPFERLLRFVEDTKQLNVTDPCNIDYLYVTKCLYDVYKCMHIKKNKETTDKTKHDYLNFDWEFVEGKYRKKIRDEKERPYFTPFKISPQTPIGKFMDREMLKYKKTIDRKTKMHKAVKKEILEYTSKLDKKAKLLMTRPH